MKVKETKVYQLFACLSAQEQKDFSRFLATHSKDKKTTLRKSLRFLCAVAGDMAVDDRFVPTLEDWGREVFVGEKFTQRMMSKHQNAMIADLEAFLVDRKLRKEADAQQAGLRKCEQILLLLASLAERGKDKLFEKYARKADKLLSSLPQEGEYFGLRYKLGLLLIAHQQKRNHARDQDFIRVKRDLDRYYSLHTLYLAQGVGAKKLKTELYRDLFDLSCVTQLVGNDTAPSPLADLMLDFLTLREDYNVEEWTALHDRLRLYKDFRVVPKHIWLDLGNSLFNMASRRISTGQLEYYEAALQFYQLIHDVGILPQVLQESPKHWLNLKMISNACGDHTLYQLYAGKGEGQSVEKKTQEGRDEFDVGLDLYFSRDYRAAKSIFHRIYLLADKDDKSAQLAAGIYVIRCLYELKEFDELKDFMTTFQNWAVGGKRKKDDRKMSYVAFFDAIKSLCDFRFHGVSDQSRKRKLLKLREKVAATPAIVSRKWLLEKIDELL
jgi:hypothetical protein